MQFGTIAEIYSALNCIQFVFFYISLHSIHYTDKPKTELSQLCKLITKKTTNNYIA